ncbi:hypothetical protein F52700_4687 [Fusarium sp. NRRL 52700]|nr:hypothetical protein F52700_4687 [Fusarium sp. NRRL 52700]
MPPSPRQSLHGLSVENSWFATRPLFWTYQHLDLLGIHFQHFDGPLHAPQPRGDDAIELDAVEVVFHVMRFTMIPETADHLKSAFYLLSNLASPLRLKPKPFVPRFFYAGRPVHGTFCLAFHVTSPFPQMVIGCTYNKAFNRQRWRQCSPRSHPKIGKDHPVKRICKILLRKVIPKNWAEDPYIVCLLLSLAQAQRIKQKGEMPKTFPVRLLMVADGDRSFAHVFQAEIDARILKALDKPTLNLNGVTWPNVVHTKVALNPYLTFPDRIVAEMLGFYKEQM